MKAAGITQSRPAPSTNGFSLLELVMAIALIGAIAMFALDRLLFYQERTEKIAMESTLALVNMGLQVRLSELIMSNRQMRVAELELENPMRWLDPPPSNYAGEYVVPAKRGYWYYAVREHELVYTPSATTYLEVGQTGQIELRYRVLIRYENNHVTGQPAPIGVHLAPSRDFRWF